MPKIAVVVIDDENLDWFGYRGGFFGYKAHCEIANLLADVDPAALFLDFDVHRRPGGGRAQAAPSADLQPDCPSDDGPEGLAGYTRTISSTATVTERGAKSLRGRVRQVRGDMALTARWFKPFGNRQSSAD